MQGEVLHDACFYVQDNRIAYIEPLEGLGAHALQSREVIDASGHLVTPGLVNTHHHHMDQSLTRAIPAVQNAELFVWLHGTMCWRCKWFAVRYRNESCSRIPIGR